MVDLDQIAAFAQSYFLSEYSPASRKTPLKDAIAEFVSQHYSKETVDRFIDQRHDAFQDALVVEYNERLATKMPLRYRFASGAGTANVIEGNPVGASDERVKFQDSLRALTPLQFENISVAILQELKCEQVFSTPASHDQGVDAFGYKNIAPSTSYAVNHKLVWIAQAKHYGSSTSSLREIVGTKELLVSRIFSTVDERYKDLKLAPYAPAALALVLSEDLTSSMRRLSERAGIFVFAAPDIFDMFRTYLPDTSTLALTAFIEGRMDGISVLR